MTFHLAFQLFYTFVGLFGSICIAALWKDTRDDWNNSSSFPYIKNLLLFGLAFAQLVIVYVVISVWVS